MKDITSRALLMELLERAQEVNPNLTIDDKKENRVTVDSDDLAELIAEFDKDGHLTSFRVEEL